MLLKSYRIYYRLTGALFTLSLITCPITSLAKVSNPIADTGQTLCYDNVGVISCPEPGRPFYGQDGNYSSAPSAYQNNGDGTVTDLITGLMWSKGVNETKVSLKEAQSIAKSLTLGGYSDWRVPTIKELYSLINFSGDTGSREKGGKNGIPTDAIPFINTDYFDFRYGNTLAGERFIDAQWLSSTRYVSTTMGGSPTLFGVNFADGRIKGYPDGAKMHRRGEKKYYARYVRGSYYGDNQFVDNGNGTISDNATGLMWMQGDSSKAMSWQDALKYAENMEYVGYDDWRLPNAKELQFLVDYRRSPDTTHSAAINPIFHTSSITNEAGQKDYPFFWTSTTHAEGYRKSKAVYISFGRGIGQMRGKVMDVHGAGSQRSDPKVGNARLGHGPQGDAVRINNFVRLVRGGKSITITGKTAVASNSYPSKIKILQNTKKGNHVFTQQHQRPGNSGMRNPNQHMSQKGQGQQGPRMGKGQRGADQFISKLDRNGDGKVSKNEFDGPKKHFLHFDKNRDGYISVSEAPTGPPPRRRK